MMLCQSRELNPWVGDCWLLGYDTRDGAKFELITSYQALLKRAEAHSQYNGLEGGIVVQDKNGEVVERVGAFDMPGDTILGGWARAHRKDHAMPHHGSVKLSVYDSGMSRWKVDPGGMIVKVAKAAVLRESFPNTVGGMYLRDEMDRPHVTESRNKTESFDDIAVEVEQVAPQPATEDTPDTVDSGGADENLMRDFLSDATIASFSEISTIKGVEQLAAEMAQATDPEDDAMLEAIAAAKRVFTSKLREARK